MTISPVLDLTNIGLLVTYNSKTSSLERTHDWAPRHVITGEEDWVLEDMEEEDV